MVTPFLPDIMQSVVQRVSDNFENRVYDRFRVYFDKGIHPQVTRNLMDQKNWPLVWFYMPEDIKFANWRVYGEANIEIYICSGTDNTWTQQQREDNNFKPRLLPVYEELMKQMKAEGWFLFPAGPIAHTRNLLPFWGLGAPNGTDKENMLQKQVDVIRIRIPKVPIKKQYCTVPYLITTN